MKSYSLWVFWSLVCLGLFAMYASGVFGQTPTTIISPDGTITYVYPGQKGGASVVMPHTGGVPTYVYPGSPAVILPPSGVPTYVYPGLSPQEINTLAPTFSSPSTEAPGGLDFGDAALGLVLGE